MSYETLIADRDFADTFLVADFQFPNGAIYAADRSAEDGSAIVFNSHTYQAIVPTGGFGEIGQLFDRKEGQLDIGVVEIRLSNVVPLANGLTASQILGAHPDEATVKLWRVAVDDEGAYFGQKVFDGIFQGPSSWDYNECKVRALSLHEKYLRDPWGRTIDSFLYNRQFMREAHDGATLPLCFGDARKSPGIIVAGKVLGPLTPWVTNAGDGEYTSEIVPGENLQKYREVPAFAINLVFTSSTEFLVTIPFVGDEPGSIDIDFEAPDYSFSIPAGGWFGEIVAGDQFFFIGRYCAPYPAGNSYSQVYFCEGELAGERISAIPRLYWNNIPVDMSGGAISKSYVMDEENRKLPFYVSRYCVAGSFSFNYMGNLGIAGVAVAIYKGKIKPAESFTPPLYPVYGSPIADDVYYTATLIDQWATGTIDSALTLNPLAHRPNYDILGTSENSQDAIHGDLPFHAGAVLLSPGWYYVQFNVQPLD